MDLAKLLSGPFAAIRLSQRLASPLDGGKLFPPTFEGGVYCYEERRIGGSSVPCVLLDSVASAANRQEEALAALIDAGALSVPHFRVQVPEVPEVGEVTTFNAPHRAFDAIFRDSEYEGKPFPKHPLYAEMAKANAQNATVLFAHAPTALLFGAWDSTGSAGGLGNKFARAIVTEIIGVNVLRGETRGGVRQDPFGISRRVEIVKTKDGWEPKGIVDKDKKDDPKRGKPSELNHGNILIGWEKDRSAPEGHEVSLRGGITCDYALQLSVISLAGLRRLRFPIDGKRDPKVDDAGRAVLAALGLVALTAARERGYALRSRCDLVADGTAAFEVISQDGTTAPEALDSSKAIELFQSAVESATRAGLPWKPEPKLMKPQANLRKLIELSRQAGAE